MAVNDDLKQQGRQVTLGGRMLVGGNVLLTTVLVIAIAGLLQWLSCRANYQRPMTHSGVSDISDASRSLLAGLDQNLRITSLYFQADTEEESQRSYRQAVDDLLRLYEAGNRSRVAGYRVNPIKDLAEYRELLDRVAKKPKFQEGVKAHSDRLDAFTRASDGVGARATALIQADLALLAPVRSSFGDSASPIFVQIEELLQQRTKDIEETLRLITEALRDNPPRYSDALTEMRATYNDLKKAFSAIGTAGAAEAAKDLSLAPEQKEFLAKAADRYKDVLATIEQEIMAVQAVKPLEADDVIDQLRPTSNAIVVETDDDVRVVDFSETWPPVDENARGEVGFKQRTFNGEERLTSAILRATHKQQTAVVLVRYGGQPLFFGGMPGQGAPMARMKKRIEDANFVVEEWDVKMDAQPPKIEPPPTKTVYVVLKPAAPPGGPMAQQQEPPFGEENRKSVLDAVTASGRAMFLTPWSPGPFGAIPTKYEFGDYLKNDWGINVDADRLIIRTVSVEPGKYLPPGQSTTSVADVENGDHPIVRGGLARSVLLPGTVPLLTAKDLPQGVSVHKLLTQPPKEGVWAIKSVEPYREMMQTQQYLTKAEGDLEGPFDVAVAASNANKKVVVVGSEAFAYDEVALAQSMLLTGTGLAVRAANPGNVSLMINSLHWLNDNEQFMNIGRPINAAVLQIEKDSAHTAVRIFTLVLWPGLAMACGVAVWWMRRR